MTRHVDAPGGLREPCSTAAVVDLAKCLNICPVVGGRDRRALEGGTRSAWMRHASLLARDIDRVFHRVRRLADINRRWAQATFAHAGECAAAIAGIETSEQLARRR
jgi:hypothetical protein